MSMATEGPLTPEGLRLRDALSEEGIEITPSDLANAIVEDEGGILTRWPHWMSRCLTDCVVDDGD